MGLFGGAVLFWPFSQLSVWAAWWDVKCVFSAFMSSSVRPDPGSFRMGRLSYCSCWLSARDGGLYHRCRFLSSLALCVASARHTGQRAHCRRDRRTIHTASHSQNAHTGVVEIPLERMWSPVRPLTFSKVTHTTVKGLTLDSIVMTSSRSIFFFFLAFNNPQPYNTVKETFLC